MLPPHLHSTLPFLLAASLTTTPHPSPTQTPSIVYCDTPQSSPHLPPTTYSACTLAIKRIPLSDAGLKPITFSRHPSTGFQVPHTWAAGNCAIEIDVLGEEVVVTSSFAAVFIMAFEVAVGCVIQEPHLGGWGAVGEGEGLGVRVFGVGDEGGRMGSFKDG